MRRLRCRCQKHGRRACWSCVAFTVSFPVEHFLWEKLPLLKLVPPLLGLR